MNKLKKLKGAVLLAATSALPLSQAAMADVSISGWINEGITYYDDGVSSDAVQINDNGTTLGSRITLAGETEVSTGLTAGFETILEPTSSDGSNVLGLGSSGSFNDDSNGQKIGVLGSSVHFGSDWGKVTVGLQSMPTDNIAVLEDPSLTLWSSISPVFRGNGATIQGLSGATASDKTTWWSFLQCLTVPGLGIGIDCNGIYRNGIRYDLPTFGPVTVAIGHANDDVYDIAVKYKGSLGRVGAQIALGYAINQGGGGANVGGSEAENFQMQAGLSDFGASGLFGSIAYQTEESDDAAKGSGGDTDAWWLKVGAKKQWFAAGDTSISFNYGQYNDQFGGAPIAAAAAVAAEPGNAGKAAVAAATATGITGSEVQRIGISVDQYFGSSLIIYGIWEQLDLDVEGDAATTAVYGGAQELDMFTLGATYFF